MSAAAPPARRRPRPGHAAATLAAVLAATSTLLAAAGAAPAEDPAFVESVLVLEPTTARVVLRDLDGDGRLDLLRVGAAGITATLQRDDGRFPDVDDARVGWPSDTVGWDIADLDGDGRTELLTLVDGRSLLEHAWDVDTAAFDSRTRLEGLAGYLPHGLRHLKMTTDVDADGRLDVVIPSTGRYLMYLGLPDGGLAPPIEVGFEPEIRLALGDPDELDSRFGQDIRVPWFELDDIDGDGRRDLISRNDDDVHVYLTRDSLPAQPSWSLDVAALRAELGERPEIDLSDLTALAGRRVSWKVADVDGRGARDLVLQRGGLFGVYLEGSLGPELERPDQVLKASGTIIHFLLQDADGDGRLDLQLVRAERIGVGRVLRWLVVAGSLDFEVFTYRNEGGSFSRKPTTRKTVTIEIPGLLEFAERAESFGEEIEARFEVPARVACLDGDGRFDDVVDVVGRELRLYRDRVPADFEIRGIEELRSRAEIESAIEELLLGDLDALDDGGVHTIDIEHVADLIPNPAWDLRMMVTGSTPWRTHALASARERSEPREGSDTVDASALRAPRIVDLDGDGRSDVVLVDDGWRADPVRDAEGELEPTALAERRALRLLVLR